MVLLNFVFLHLIVIILVGFAAGHEPDSHNNVESDDDKQINREHEDVGPGSLIVDGYPAGSNGNEIQQQRSYGQVVDRGQFAWIGNVNERFRKHLRKCN